jgi:hypothetical protein
MLTIGIKDTDSGYPHFIDRSANELGSELSILI